MTKHLLLVSLLFYKMIPAFSQVLTVGPTGDFPSLEAAAPNISAGDTVVLLDGVFNDGTQFLQDLNGNEEAPIIIMAQHLHGAIFREGTEAIHLINCSFLQLHGLVVEQQSGNGINIDDGGDYATPTHHISIIQCIFRDMTGTGNNDLLKLSGLDDFLIKDCSFITGSAGGSGVDMVGCHRGIIEDNLFDQAGTSGIQAKGGTQYIQIQRNIFRDMGQRAINLGGSTGLQFFRPPLPNPITNAFEAADLEVFSNIFIGSWAPVAFVGCVRVNVFNNTFYKPENWAIRILQETTEPGFLPCGDNEYRNNIIYLSQDITEVNIGPNTDAASFIFTNNLWFNETGDASWSPVLPVIDSNQVIEDPLFVESATEDYSIPGNSPAVLRGIKLLAPTHDFVQHTFYDPPSIGAYEGHESITSAEYLIQDRAILMGPNPTTGSLIIDGDFSQTTVHILDSNGMLVQDFSQNSTPLTINLNGLPNGLYFISIKSKLHAALEVIRVIKMGS